MRAGKGQVGGVENGGIAAHMPAAGVAEQKDLTIRCPLLPATVPHRECGGFFIAGLIAWFPHGMVTLGTVLMLNSTRDGFALPNLVASTAILACALIVPQLSRLADVHGQTRIAVPTACIALLAYGGLIAALLLDWPDWALFASAVGIGFMPNFGAFSRARWSHLYTGTPLLHITLFGLCHWLATDRHRLRSWPLENPTAPATTADFGSVCPDHTPVFFCHQPLGIDRDVPDRGRDLFTLDHHCPGTGGVPRPQRTANRKHHLNPGQPHHRYGHRALWFHTSSQPYGV